MTQPAGRMSGTLDHKPKGGYPTVRPTICKLPLTKDVFAAPQWQEWQHAFRGRFKGLNGRATLTTGSERSEKAMAGDALVGQEVDGYRILEVLGRGGMGVVYRAENLSLGRVEALKVIAPALVQDAHFLRRFRMEAQALARIHHPNIVTVFAQRQAAMGVYLTMEYVEGQTLADVLDARGPMPWAEAWPLMKQLLEAFAYAHDRGIIHRDIKPRNIMLTPEGVVKVMDFGLAKFYQQHELTQTQGVAGTLYYMSPEQIKGSRTLDQRSDIFSLGMTLYQILSGRLPFDKTESQYAIQRSIVEGRLPRPEQFNAEVPDRLADLVMRALETKLTRRYQVAGEFLDALQAFEDERTLTAAAPLSARRTGREARRPRMARLGMGVGSLLLLGSLGWWMLAPLESSLQEESAIAAADAWTARTPDVADDSSADGAGAPATDGPDSLDPSAATAEAGRAEQRLSGGSPAEGPDARTRAPDATSSSPEARRQPAPSDAAVSDPTPALLPGLAASEATAPADAERPVAGGAGPGEGPASLSEEPPPAGADAGRAGEADARPAPAAIPSAEARIQADLDELSPRLQRAIVDNEWAALPPPLVRFYRDMLAPVYARHRIQNAALVPGQVQEDEAGARVAVRVFVEYQQRGREGLRSVPIPAVWVWEQEAGAYVLARVAGE